MSDVNALERRCPRLGGPVAFAYCRAGDTGESPCFKILDCWWERFDVVSLLRQEMDPEQFERLSGQPPPQKVSSLIELIEKTRSRMEK